MMSVCLLIILPVALRVNVHDVSSLKVAIVDDYLTVDGGAQKALREVHAMWPNAPVYTVTYFPEKFTPPLTDWDIRTSWVSRLLFSRTFEQQYKIFYPCAIESLVIEGYDLVISSTYAGYSKAIILPPETMHISWVHTVPRYLWGYRTSRHERVHWLYKKLILPPLEHYWRIWDRQTSRRPDYIVTNSQNIADRVQKSYRREASVLYPPVAIDDLLELPVSSGDYFIYFGRLEKYKCVDMAIRACIAAGQKIKIIGTGSYEQELRDLVKEEQADDVVEFMGWMVGQKLHKQIAGAKAFIFPGPDEDFGMVMVESLAAGTPVIAFDLGGAREILEDGVTGVVIKTFSQEALNDVVSSFDPKQYRVAACRKRSRDFGAQAFRDRLTRFIAEIM